MILLDLDGTVRDANTPLLHADDLAAVRGDGVFETLLIRDGKVCNVARHLERLGHSAALLDLPAPDVEQWEFATVAAAEAWVAATDVGTEGLLRLVYSRGRESAPTKPTAYLTVGPVAERARAARRDGVTAITLDRGYSIDLGPRAPWQLLGAKTLSYATNMAALRYAADQGADDVIYVSSEGAVLEGPRSTVIAAFGNTLVTPDPVGGVLAGTTQRAVFELAESEGWQTEIRAMRREELIAADSVWLISSVTLVARVTELNGYTLPVPTDSEKFTDLVNRAVRED